MIFKSVCLKVENLQICNLQTGLTTKFAGLQFGRLAYLRNFLICDCVLSSRICGFLKKLRGHLCKFATDVNDTGGKLSPVSTTPAVNLPSMSMGVHLEL
jgi:hypothetical protein